MVKVIRPVTIRTKAGSRAMLVRRERLLKVSFSVHAQTPTARMLSPSSQNMTLNPNMTYFRQQETSDWSRLYRLTGILASYSDGESPNHSKYDITVHCSLLPRSLRLTDPH